MAQPQKEYIDYLTRLIRNTNKSMSEFNLELAFREVGKSYGCNETEMDEAVRVAEREGME